MFICTIWIWCQKWLQDQRYMTVMTSQRKRRIIMHIGAVGLIAYWSRFMQKFNAMKSSLARWTAHILYYFFKDCLLKVTFKDNRHFKIQNSTEHVWFHNSYIKVRIQDTYYTSHLGLYWQRQMARSFLAGTLCQRRELANILWIQDK